MKCAGPNLVSRLSVWLSQIISEITESSKVSQIPTSSESRTFVRIEQALPLPVDLDYSFTGGMPLSTCIPTHCSATLGTTIAKCWRGMQVACKGQPDTKESAPVGGGRLSSPSSAFALELQTQDTAIACPDVSTTASQQV